MLRLFVFALAIFYCGLSSSARTPVVQADTMLYEGRKLYVIPDAVVNGAVDSFGSDDKLFVVIPAMADGLRADGKIWVVVAVLATIFAGLLAWLIRMDRKLSRMEKDRRLV